ncbi:MAG: hypothetical protein LBL39_03460, partial [Planctomycetaceae bacterium]|nr:hypothetical protein [Planctomycetaceae bacterium]
MKRMFVFVLFVAFGLVCQADEIDVAEKDMPNSTDKSIVNNVADNNVATESPINVPLLFVKRNNYLGLHIYDT